MNVIPPAGPRLGIPALRCVRSWLAVALFSLLSAAGWTQSAAVGTIAGSAVNDATRKVLERATVTVAGTVLATLTAADGTFRLGGVPAGPQQVLVGYAGLEDAAVSVVVAAGGVATVNVALKSEAVQLLANFVDDTPINIVTREDKDARQVYDAEIRYRFTPRYTLSLAGRNVTEAEEGQHLFAGRATRTGTGGGTALTLTLAARF